jgi:hypothetical protein
MRQVVDEEDERGVIKAAAPHEKAGVQSVDREG